MLSWTWIAEQQFHDEERQQLLGETSFQKEAILQLQLDLERSVQEKATALRAVEVEKHSLRLAREDVADRAEQVDALRDSLQEAREHVLNLCAIHKDRKRPTTPS